MDRNEDYIEVRVPRGEWPAARVALGKTFAYRRLSHRDGAWGLVWDLEVEGELEAVRVERDVLVACLRRATALLTPKDRELVRSYYRDLIGAENG